MGLTDLERSLIRRIKQYNAMMNMDIKIFTDLNATNPQDFNSGLIDGLSLAKGKFLSLFSEELSAPSDTPPPKAAGGDPGNETGGM